jgi:hypothetical protein
MQGGVRMTLTPTPIRIEGQPPAGAVGARWVVAGDGGVVRPGSVALLLCSTTAYPIHTISTSTKIFGACIYATTVRPCDHATEP